MHVVVVMCMVHLSCDGHVMQYVQDVIISVATDATADFHSLRLKEAGIGSPGLYCQLP